MWLTGSGLNRISHLSGLIPDAQLRAALSDQWGGGVNWTKAHPLKTYCDLALPSPGPLWSPELELSWN